MRTKTKCLTAAATLLVAAGASTAPAQAADLRPDCSKKLIKSANHHRAIVIKKLGKRAPGRDIVKYGRIGPNQRPHAVRDCKLIRKYRDQLKQLHTPAPVGLVRTAVDPAQPPAGVQTPSVAGPYGGYAIPESIVMCESGGDPTAVNTDNPNRPAGYYQIITSTWLAHGGGAYAPTADAASPEAQHIIAARIWNGGAGRGQWEC